MKRRTYQTNAEYIEAMMKQFKLVDMREQYRDLILEAESSSMDYESFLIRLLSVEEDGKRSRRTEKLQKEACFESGKGLEDIDYSFNHSLDKDKITELGRLDFIEAGENVIIIGPPGVGKSMIATGIGMNAVIGYDFARMEIYFNSGDKEQNKKVFDYLYSKRDEIEEEYGKPFIWERLTDKVTCRIKDENEFHPFEMEDRTLVFEFLKDASDKMSVIFHNRILDYKRSL